jgi:outer membrane protein OmpU
MNKLKLVGVSALCGSLAAFSAQAGEMSVSGGATATYTTKEGAVTGQPLGMATGLTFTGSGELDNGNTFTVNIAHDDQNTWSAADIAMTVAGVGTFKFDQGGGTGMDRLDDKMPTAWEESYDAGGGSGIVTVTGVGGGTDIEWAVDSGMLPDGLSAYISYSPEADSAKVNDKSVGGGDNGVGYGYDLVLEHSGLADGLNVFAGYTSIKSDFGNDQSVRAYGATYAVGSVTVGYQYTKDEMGRTSVDFYENSAWGVSFAVNDDLSLSYGTHESEQSKGPGDASVTLETSSMQAAYSMGGMSIKFAMSDISNASYSTATKHDYDVNSLAISLAF